MSRFNPFQWAYLLASTALGILSCLACLVAATRQLPRLETWPLALGLTLIYGLLWTQAEEFETPTAQSPTLIEVSDAPLLVALTLIGPAAVPLLLAADALARLLKRQERQPLGYLFNFNLLATDSVVTLTVIHTITGGDLSSIAALPAGPARYLIILAAFTLTAQANSALLVAVGSRKPVLTIIASDAHPLALVKLIPGAMGLLIVGAAVSAPGLVAPMLIPIVLSRYAIQAIARWARRHALLEQQVAAQTEAIRAQADQIAAQEQARHQHTVLLVHDLEKELRLGDRLVRAALIETASVSPRPSKLPEPGSPLVELAGVFARSRAMSEDILLGSALRAGRATLQRAPTNLTALAAGAVARYLPVAAAADVQLTLDCDDVLELALDAPKLDRALANLLTNAIDYTKGCARRAVTLTLSGTPEAAQICVSDTGMGIEPEALAQIGRRFTRLSGGQEAHHGYGLGLFGVAAIVALHGGSIDVSSPGRGLGTNVRITLPRAAQPTAHEHTLGPTAARPQIAPVAEHAS